MVDHTHIYKLNEVALSSDINASHASDADAKRAAPSFTVGDGAFIRRSDKVWRYAKVIEVSLNVPAPTITFIVSDDGSTKKIGPRHWGNRVRPLKREMAVNGRGRTRASRFLSKNDLRSSPQDVQISAELERTVQSAAGGGESRRCVIDKLSDNESDNTKNDDPVKVEVVDEVVYNQRPRQNRRESWKDIASGFIKRLSGCDRVTGDTSLNRLASETTIDLEDMKICDSSDRSSNIAYIQVPKSDAARQNRTKPKPRRELGSFSLTNPPTERKPRSTKEQGSFSSLTNPPTHQKGRKPNRREKGSFSLTTSLIFKNLMKGGDAMSEILDGNDPSNNRRATVTLGTTNKEGYASASDAATPKKAVGGKYKPKRNRRATVQSGPSSVAMRGGGPTSDMFGRSNSSRETKSNSKKMAPRPSVIMKSAFQQLMEDRAYSSQKRIVD